MKFFKNQKPSLGLPAFEILFKSRRCQRRPLPPISKGTSLVIFLKAALEFGFLFFKGLLPYKTLVSSSHNEDLLRPFDPGEVKSALFFMFGEKSSGPNGLNPSFFQHY